MKLLLRGIAAAASQFYVKMIRKLLKRVVKMGEDREKLSEETYIDYSSKDDRQLQEILEELLREEQKISYRRRVLHGKIDLLRAELVRRKKKQLANGESLVSDADIKRLSDILAGEALGKSKFDPTRE